MKDASVVFKAIADSNRRMILQVLKKQDMAAGDIAALFIISMPAISRHLSILKAAELVTERREGNSIIYHLNSENLAVCLSGFISSVCPLEMIERKRKTKGQSGRR